MNDQNKLRKQLEGLSENDKTRMLAAIADVLFPGGQLDSEWSSDEVGEVGDIILSVLQHRYVLKQGTYSQHFYDNKIGKAVPLQKVLDMLNGSE